MALLAFGKDQYTAIANPNDTGIDSSTVKCGARAKVPRASYQLQHTVLVGQVGVAMT